MLSHNLLLTGDDGGYNLTKSLRIRKSASAYLSRTPSVSGNRNIWTVSFWFKRGQLSGVSGSQSWYTAGTGGNIDTITINANDKISIDVNNTTVLVTTQVFRDPSAWYHIVFAVDTSQATASNRAKLYINGSLVTAFDTDSRSSITNNLPITNTTVLHKYGYYDAGILFADIYYTEINFIDGQQLTASSFGSTNATTGVWQPAKYTGTYGTNGYYLPFTDTTSTSTLGTDFSGNSNTWTVNNISLTAGATYDSMTDVPTLTSATQANYCVFNPISSGGTITNGNLSTSNNDTTTYGTVAITTEKFYWEYTITACSGGAAIALGVSKDTSRSPAGVWGASDVFLYQSGGNKYGNGTSGAYGATYTTGDVIGVALDMTGYTLTFYKNNVSQGTAFSSTQISPYILIPMFYGYPSGNSTNVNFGQQPFTYTPPTGFVALNTFNLPTSTIVKGNTVMDATTYAGTSATQSVTNTTGFKPDFIWIKNRTGANDNILFDSNRGSNGSYYYELISNGATAENYYTAGNYGMVSAINSNGFTLASSNSNWSLSNATGNNYVGWQWQAGQGSSSSNTSGSITSTVSVNATAGFSVVTYTGTLTAAGTATVGHGLGVAPSMIIFKARNAATSWPTFHTSLTSWNYSLFLDLTNAQTDQTSNGSMSAPTSTVFSTNWTTGMNISGNTQVAYCFAPIAGYSAFGSYTGNSSTDGPFVYLGFRPRFVMVKASSGTTGDWLLLDTSRDSYNMAVNLLNPNVSDAEAVISPLIDILSNGFKIRRNSAGTNGSGNTYIYMAFAENPFKNALAR